MRHSVSPGAPSELPDGPEISERAAVPPTPPARAREGARESTPLPPAAPPGTEREPAPIEPVNRRDPPRWLQSLGAFWTKINHDWIFNLAGLLAYNFLLALFPILLLLLALFGVVVRELSPEAEKAFEQALAALLPGDIGQQIVASIVSGFVANLEQSIPLLALVGLIGAAVAGSRLFITLENCFGIIFRLRGRDVIRQNLMAAGMLIAYLILIPTVFLGSLVPSLASAVAAARGWGRLPDLLSGSSRLLPLLATAVIVWLLYAIVPNRPREWRSWRRNWRGTLLTTLLLWLYELLFPVYQEHFVHVQNYGSIGAFAIVILLFFYYLALILLLGAEVNSWAAGQRETASDLPGLLHAVQVHRTLEGAAGPTAGQPREEMQRHSPSWLARLTAWAVQRARARLQKWHRRQSTAD